MYSFLDIICIAALGGWAYTAAKRKQRDEVGWAAMAALSFYIVGMAFESIISPQVGWEGGQAKLAAYVSGVLAGIIVNIVLHTRLPLEPPSDSPATPKPDTGGKEPAAAAEGSDEAPARKEAGPSDPAEFLAAYWPTLVIALMYAVTQLEPVIQRLSAAGWEPPYPPIRECILPLLIGAQAWILSRRKEIALLAGLVTVAYIPAINAMEWRWGRGSSYYSHGYLIPFVVWWLVRMNGERLEKLEAKGDFRFFGLGVLTFGLLTLLLGTFIRANTVQGISLVILICGLVFFLCGRAISRILLFPLLFLFTMVPLPMAQVQDLTFKLKMGATWASVNVVDMLYDIGLHSYIVIQNGSYVQWEKASGALDEIIVGDVCSGLRSLIALIAFGALFAYIAKLSKTRKLILFAAAAPISMLANMWRIVTLTFIACRWGSESAHGWVHDVTGYGIFAVAFVLFFAFERFLQVFEPRETPPVERPEPQAA